MSSVEISVIGLKTTNGESAQRIQHSLQAYCLNKGIRLIKFSEKIPEDVDLENELVYIAKNDLRIDGFKDFRNIKFYSNPDINKDVVELSQSQIIHEIIRQAQNSYDESKGYRDIFITASTGAGKSVMFQIPAVYLAKKYQKLTIIIEPVKALMQDQKEKLFEAGYTRVEAFNSDLITQVEKENVLKRIKSGEVDLLYLSPETLLSYSIETIIGEREIGLMIVDEAHIVTTWGVGFRPDGFAMKKCIESPHDQHYDESNYYNKEGYKQVIESFKREKNYYKDSLIIKHHKNKYASKMPLWVMVELMSFSNVSKLYSSMYVSDKEEIAFKRHRNRS